MEPGSLIKLVSDIEFSISNGTRLCIGAGQPGVVISKINTHGFCQVKIKVCDEVSITTYIHKKMIELR
jgi:hypothetical protein